MMVQTPHLAIIPLLNEEQMIQFLHLTIEMAKVILGDEAKRGNRTFEDENQTDHIAQQIA